MQEHKVMIGIPVFNDCYYFKIAVDCIIKSTQYPFKLVIVESESTDGSKEYSDDLKNIYPNKDIEVIHTKKEGPLAAYLKLFEKAKEYQMDLYLTQTDVIHFPLFGRDWLLELVKLSKLPDCGLVGTLQGGGIAGARYKEGFGWIGGWSCYVPIRIINEFGGYDPNFEIGDGVDIEYSYRVQNAGYKMYMANFWVDHHWLTAHVNEVDNKDKLEGIKIRNGRYFRKKYNLHDQEKDI